jgi:hypothetical protein
LRNRPTLPASSHEGHFSKLPVSRSPATSHTHQRPGGQSHSFEVKNSAYPLAQTLDHIVADSIGQTTPYSTLELSCNDHKNNIESIYFDNMSWYGTDEVTGPSNEIDEDFELITEWLDLV